MRCLVIILMGLFLVSSCSGLNQVESRGGSNGMTTAPKIDLFVMQIRHSGAFTIACESVLIAAQKKMVRQFSAEDISTMSDVQREMLLRYSLDSILARGNNGAEISRCSDDDLWALVKFVRKSNAEFVNRYLNEDFVERVHENPRSTGALDVIARHYNEDLSGGDNLAENLRSIYTSLLGGGAIDPFSYAGIVDNLEIRDHGRQLYGSYFTCENGQPVFSPPIVNPREMRARRELLADWDLWPDQRYSPCDRVGGQ